MLAKLTPAFIAKPPLPAGHQVVYWDQAQAGFGLMVTPTGHRSFVCQYRVNGKSRRATIKFSPGLDAARREARAIQGSVARGADPVGEKRAARRAAGTTLKAVIEAYLAAEGDKLRTVAARALDVRPTGVAGIGQSLNWRSTARRSRRAPGYDQIGQRPPHGRHHAGVSAAGHVVARGARRDVSQPDRAGNGTCPKPIGAIAF